MVNPRLITAILLAGALVTPARADDVEQLDRIDALLAAGRADEAVATASSLLVEEGVEPCNVWRVRQRLGVALVMVGRPAEAVPQLEAALQAAPDEPALHLNLGRALRVIGHGGRAVAEYGQAVDLAPDRYQWRLEYAEALRDLGIRRDALAQVRRAQDLCADCPDALRAEVIHHQELGDRAAMAAPLRAMLAVDPSPEYRRLLAQVLMSLDDAAGVVALLDPVPEARLDGEELALLLEADRRLQRPDRALRWIRANDDLVPRVARPEDHTWALLAEICLAADEPAAALAAVDRAIAARPEAAVHHHNRAAILVRLGREAEARQALERARQLDPNLGGSP